MPVRGAESLTTLRVQCRAPNSLADSRHQVSDRGIRTARSRQAGLRAPDRSPASIRVISRGIASDEYFVSYPT